MPYLLCKNTNRLQKNFRVIHKRYLIALVEKRFSKLKQSGT